MRTLDLESLAIFKLVAEEGGITKAAQRLNRVQSNVTTRVQQLEERLGTKLFHRTGRKLLLSAKGKVLMGYAERLLRLSAEAEAEVANDKPGGPFRIGTIESVAATRLPPILSDYHRKYPEVRFDLSSGMTDTLIERVLEYELEAAFVAQAPLDNRLEGLPAFDEELVLIGAKDSPNLTNAAQIGRRTVIAFSAGCAYRRTLENWLYRSKITPERILELDSYHAIVSCVAAGTGVALVPQSVIQALRAEHDVTVSAVPRLIRRATVTLLWRRGWQSAALRALSEMVAKAEPAGPLIRSRPNR